MRLLALSASIMCLSITLNASDGPVCPKCEIIREYNKNHPENNYYWYDDYIKDQGKSGTVKEASNEPTSKSDNASKKP